MSNVSLILNAETPKHCVALCSTTRQDFTTVQSYYTGNYFIFLLRVTQGKQWKYAVHKVIYHVCSRPANAAPRQMTSYCGLSKTSVQNADLETVRAFSDFECGLCEL